MRYIICICLVIIAGIASAQQSSKEEIHISQWIDGTLLVPKSDESVTLAILIQGSGPTDRDGNQPMMHNNSLKMLAEALLREGIATFRYDKRLVKMVQQPDFSEEDISFDNFIKDAKDVIAHFEADQRFDKIVIIGHSQGSLVGMIAAQDTTVDGFISIAGAGQEIDDVIVDQIGRQAPMLKDNARTAFDDLRVNGVALNYDQNLASIFRPEIQPFMLSWMQYNPQTEIQKLTIPILIINGKLDLQVDINEAKLLHQVQPKAQMLIIETMNHVLKKVDTTDYLDNGKSYNEPKRPLMNEVTTSIIGFIREDI